MSIARSVVSSIARPLVRSLVQADGGGLSFDFYVDSVNGDDGNDGLTAATAFATIGAAQTAAIAFGDGVRIGLAGGSYWREMLDLSTLNNVTVSAYGVTTALPVLDAADVISGGTWDDSTARADANTNVYSRTLTWDGAAGFLSIWRNGQGVAPATSLANCQATPNTFWTSNGVAQGASGASATVFIHPPGSANPNTDGAEYEFSRRSYAVRLGGNSCTAIGLHTRRQTHADGSLVLGLNATITACLAREGVKHECFLRSGIAQKTVVWHPFSDNRTTATGFIAYNTLGDGQSYVFRKCIAKGPFLNGTQSYDGFFAHTSSLTDIHLTGLVEECSAVECSNLSSCSAISMQEIRNSAKDCAGLAAGVALSGFLEVVDCQFISTINRASRVIGGTNAANPPRVEGLRVYSAGTTTFDAVCFNNGDINLSRSVVVLNNEDAFSSVIRCCDLAGRSINIDKTIFVVQKNTATMYSWFTPGHQVLGTLQNNVYFDDSPGDMSYRIDGTVYIGASNYLAAFPETGTITTDPGLVDPANGNFNLTAPLANGAGLERPDIEYTPIPADLAEAEAWVISQL